MQQWAVACRMYVREQLANACMYLRGCGWWEDCAGLLVTCCFLHEGWPHMPMAYCRCTTRPATTAVRRRCSTWASCTRHVLGLRGVASCGMLIGSRMFGLGKVGWA